MSRSSPATPQLTEVVVRVVPKGGAKSAAQILSQWKYLSKKGRFPLQRSERHLGTYVHNDLLKQLAQSWAEQTGYFALGCKHQVSFEDLTTHIVVSFPPGTDPDRAFATGRAWTEEMFGSGRHGGIFDYLTTCHSDRPHPHVHLIVNRRAFEGHWLKISRRHATFNYKYFRTTLVDVAHRHGINLQASSRSDRGLTDRPLTYAEYRRQLRNEALRNHRLSPTISSALAPDPTLPTGPTGDA